MGGTLSHKSLGKIQRTILTLIWIAPIVAAAAGPPVFKHSDVVFMYSADAAAYKAYGATFVAWGGASTTSSVKMHHDLGIRCTGAMWCLTAGARLLYENTELREAVSRDIEGNPVAVPWLFDHTFKGMPTYFGCTNHPAFRQHVREQVRKAMAGGADGLHIDDHLGTAGSVIGHGGGFCDYCMAGFRQYLKNHATPEQLAKAGITDLERFDYRDWVRKYAATRKEYLKIWRKIPLMDLFERYQVEAAAENVRELGELGAQIAGHPILLSANAPILHEQHRPVVKYLTHIVSETHFNASQGTTRLDDAIKTFEIARQLEKPLAATAFGWDWAHIHATSATELVRVWIALTYAHGQWFMVPHPTRQWCFNNERGTHWHRAPIAEYAPLYQFIRANARWFDDFEWADASGVQTTPSLICTVRRNENRRALAVHVINRDYDPKTDWMRPAKHVRITLPSRLAEGLGGTANLLRYDAAPQTVPIRREGGRAVFEIPEVRLWTVAGIEPTGSQ